ncbi:MAG: hypothetical protein LBD79_10860 [Treponema sp.]|nr:hypothetical protein [Treponema sp.]
MIKHTASSASGTGVDDTRPQHLDRRQGQSAMSQSTSQDDNLTRPCAT